MMTIDGFSIVLIGWKQIAKIDLQSANEIFEVLVFDAVRLPLDGGYDATADIETL